MKAAEINVQELAVTNTVIGKGAFGEVRIAQWRGMDVAYKVLHATTPSEQQEVEDNLRHEVEILSQLRHPNLVLFLGVCLPEDQSMALVTELLPCSLYDIIEDRKIKLSLPDILDYSLDIIHGLDYLHSLEPSIVHRDISAKNILIAGTRAKIADLGQAKLFSHNTLSRQTGMPGAMAYSAPEVLTGKYSSKIDVFSFGLLVCQTCTNEYPRVDRREEQIRSAISAYPCLEQIIVKSLSYNPADRPNAKELSSQLQAIKDNDRYYPISRRSPPEQEISAEIAQYMLQKTNAIVSELNLKLEQVTKQLKAEEGRWKKEADQVDLLQDTLHCERSLRKEVEEQNRKSLDELVAWREKSHRESVQCEGLRDQVKLMSIDFQRLQNKHSALEQTLNKKSQDYLTLNEEYMRMKQEYENAASLLEKTGEQNEGLLRRTDLLNRQLHVQLDYTKDLEGRLEQALSRWRSEKEQFSEQERKYKTLSRQYTGIVEKNEAMKREKDRIDERLKQYEGLPVPEEIKARMDDLHRDNHQLSSQLLLLEEKAQRVEGERAQLQEDVSQQTFTLKMQSEQLTTLQHKVSSLSLSLSQAQSDLEREVEKSKVLERERREMKGELDLAVKESSRLRETVDKLTLEIGEVKAKLMRRREGDQEKEVGEGEGKDEFEEEELERRVMSSPPLSPVRMNLTNPLNPHNEPEEYLPNADRISDIAVKHQVERAMGREGARGLLELMQTSPNDERVLWRCIRSLRELALHDPLSKEQCLSSFPETWLPPALRRFLSHSMLQAQGARFLGTLAFGNDLFRRKAGEGGVLVSLSEAMSVHLEDETVVLHGCTALTNLTHNSYENKCRLMEIGGIEILLQAMERHRSSAKVQCQGCWAILTIGGEGAPADKIFQVKGYLSVTEALSAHSHDPAVQQYGIWAIKNLALAHEGMGRELRAQGAVELCRIAIEQHKEQGEVLEQARQTVAVLLANALPPPVSMKINSTSMSNMSLNRNSKGTSQRK